MGSNDPAPPARGGLFRRLSALTLQFFCPHPLLQANVLAVGTLLPAFVLTWLIFAGWNSVTAANIETTFATGQLQDFRKATSSTEAADRAVELKWADPKIRVWLREVMKAPSEACTTRQQAVAIFQSAGPGGPTEAERLELLHAAATGQRKPGLPLPAWLARGFWFELKAPTGLELYDAQAKLQDRHWLRTVESTNPILVEEKKKFARCYLDAFAGEMNEPIREMRRLNGWVQWLTVFLALTVLIAVLRRWVLITRLTVSARRARAAVEKHGTLGPHAAVPATSEIGVILDRLGSGAVTVPGATEEVLRLRESADAAIYGLFASLSAAIPALGFLGTVIGMGEALLYADGLFSSQDKQRVVGQITQGLGLAFDATLVSLFCAPITVVIQALVRASEYHMFARWVGVLHELRD